MKSLSFSQYEKDDLELEMDDFLIRGCAITGAKFPPNERYAEILISEFTSFLLKFGFEQLNIDELVLAFHFNSKAVKYDNGEVPDVVLFANRVFNVTDAAAVLNVYLNFRNTVNRKLENFIDGY